MHYWKETTGPVGRRRYTAVVVVVVCVSSCRVFSSLAAPRGARSEPSSSAHRGGRRPRGAGAGMGAGACGLSGRVVLAVAVEQGGDLVTSRCAVVFNDTTTDGTARADANANAESAKEADR